MDAPTHERSGLPLATTPVASDDSMLGLSLPECAERLRREPDLCVPALITLRRWSADGDLDAARLYVTAQRARQGRAAEARPPRPRYDYARVLQVVRAQQSTLRRYSAAAIQAAPVQRVPSPDQTSAAPAATGMSQALAQPRPPVADLQQQAPPAAGSTAAFTQMDVDKLAQACAAATTTALGEQLQPMVKEALEQLQRQLVAAMDNIEATRRTLMLKYDAALQTAKNQIAELQAQNAALRAAASPVDVGRLATLMSRVADRLDRM